MISERVRVLKRGFRLTTKQQPINKSKIQWSDLIPNVLAEYNNKNKHRIIGMTPSEAKKPSNEVDATMAMELVARKGKRFSILQIGDIVRILRKKKTGEKGWAAQFQRGEYTIESISENFGHQIYELSDGKEYIRSDIVRMGN